MNNRGEADPHGSALARNGDEKMSENDRTVWVLKKLERSDEFQYVSVYATREKAVAAMEEDIREIAKSETEYTTSDDFVRGEDGLGAKYRNTIEWRVEEMKVA